MTESIEETAAVEAVEVVADRPTPAPKAPRSVPRTERPIQTVGRRKEAIVRVRIVPGTGKFTLFDWEKEYCEAAFNQRFPVLTEKPGPLEGNLQYALTSVGIKATFGARTLRLKIRIRDRALNVSNDVQTEEFTLDKIKR